MLPDANLNGAVFAVEYFNTYFIEKIGSVVNYGIELNGQSVIMHQFNLHNVLVADIPKFKNLPITHYAVRLGSGVEPAP